MAPVQLILQQILNLLISWFAFFKNGQRWRADNVIRPYVINGTIVSEGCNGINFYNQGDVSVYINDAILLKPDRNYTIAQIDPRVGDNTPYKLRFDPSAPGSTGTDQNCVVTVTNLTQL